MTLIHPLCSVSKLQRCDVWTVDDPMLWVDRFIEVGLSCSKVIASRLLKASGCCSVLKTDLLLGLQGGRRRQQRRRLAVHHLARC